MMIEQPGCAHITVATPMTGIVTEVATTMGQAVEPGDPLFEMRLTHEDLVRTQVEFVRTLGELDVELKELERLRDISESGAIAGRSFLERQYARDKLQALIQAQRESLRLHGLSEAQVQQITEDRRLLQDLRIVVPPAHQHSDHAELHLSDRETPSTVLVSDSEELPHRPDR
jgi:cobalt-zinc-cadmium efflux system membrane fusion protein